ncbi:MAG TPA: DUF4333 domain-containing protein [Solirubrobacteraceae bacterium]|nr:DUF4333 domain-containing protein [Solirubrobacteraceae bacterium]
MNGKPKRPAKPVLTGTALLALACLSACGSSAAYLDSARVERAIARSILREHGLYTKVACPARVPLRTGYVFKCSALLGVGAYPVTATEIGGDGQVRYRDPRPLAVLDIAKVQRAIAASILSQRHIAATVSCPSDVLQQAGLSFRCTAVIDGGARRYAFIVSELGNAGHVRFVGT